MKPSYFINISEHNSSKLGEAITGEVKHRFNHTVIPVSKFEQLINDVKVIIAECEFRIPRCPSLKLDCFRSVDPEGNPRTPQLDLIDAKGHAAFYMFTTLIREPI